MQLANVVNAGHGLILDLGGPTAESLTSREEDAYCVMKGTLPPGISVPLHSHGDAESFYVLSGEAQILVETKSGLEWQPVRQGDFAHIAGGTKHAWHNVYTNPFEVIIITTPRLGRFLREMCELVKAEGKGSSLEKLHELEERYGYWSGSPEENVAMGIPPYS